MESTIDYLCSPEGALYLIALDAWLYWDAKRFVEGIDHE